MNNMLQITFSVYENKGVFAVLLGSGLSRAAGIPTGWDITVDLIKRVGHLQGVKDQEDWASWYTDTTGKDPSYSELLEQITSTPAERRAILNRYIEPSEEEREEGKKIPTAAHHAIACLVRLGYIKVIVTTNFDRLMENALHERGIEPTTVSSIDGLKGAEPITHSSCYILKLHGDYKDTRILNTESELRGYADQYEKQLDQIFDEYGLIVCGWSGEWDQALRGALLRAPNRRYPTYWAACESLGDGAQQLVRHRSAAIIQISDADSFFSNLQQHIETLEQTQRQNPRSIELLVNNTKRFLTKPEHRIRLDDLFTQEMENLIALLGEDRLSPPASWDASIFRPFAARYEAITQALTIMCVVLGRWGNGSELPLVVEIIRNLRRQAIAVQSGNSSYLGFRSYPAVLVFTGYALGLTRAERYEVLHQLFCSLVNKKPEGMLRIVDGLFLGTWKGVSNWNWCDELGKHPIALSEYLFKLFSEWGKPFMGLTSDFELVFDRFETLASLAFLEKYEETRIRDTLVEGYERMPVGRSSLRCEFDNRVVLEQLHSEEMKITLTQAGFAKGSIGFVDLFAANFEKVSRQAYWSMLS